MRVVRDGWTAGWVRVGAGAPSHNGSRERDDVGRAVTECERNERGG